MSKPLDVVVFGATSFVGQILCQYLEDTFNSDYQETLTWGIAGRSKYKLEQLKKNLGNASLPIFVADASDENALNDMCQQTNVVVSTVGPYALYGETLVKVCSETGTDYCDLTGEPQWIHDMLEKYEATAKESGARIVHCCGFDSIPSDLGVHFLQQQSLQHHGQYCKKVSMRVKAAKGGASGGTIASMVNITKEMSKDPTLRKKLVNPYLLCPESDAKPVRQLNVGKPIFDKGFGAWIAPFIMAGINTRVVLRSNAIAKHPYGADFTYDEAMLMGKGSKGRFRATTLVAGLGLFMVSAALKPTRWFMEKFVLPKPGEGPSPEAQKSGFYDLRFSGETSDGQVIKTKVVGQGDPGYGSTGRMLGQAAATLALNFHDDGQKSAQSGGFWTPATLFGDRLVKRLGTYSQIKFEVID
ncbi:saccharopine dehydrogenase family protein [Endozoicomonas ascidiicola]|uniref:saccharopine dehydrogenase family protein n=1 Tax=Endozoicomonas ascidiicola TaxID=1698521 RepID=UPI000829C36F|nr:saccharopine dehydrogenase NADP-binding domain-containing protein [Endozoicomonas ascidiicola]